MSAASSSDKFVEIYRQTMDDVAIWKIKLIILLILFIN